MSGLDEATPPVNAGQDASAALTSSLLSGVNQTGNGAGGFERPLAIEGVHIRQRSPASPNAPATIAASTLYGPKRPWGKARIA